MDARDQMIQAFLGKTVHVEVDRPIGYIHGDLVYPVNYGFLPGVLAGDGEEQDAYILGVDEPVSAFDGIVIGAIRRKNDCEDKLVVAPAGIEFHQGQIAQATHFQEQYFSSYITCLFNKSCGVLPYREVNAQREYLLVFENYSQCWSIPKGHMEMGESEAETALRELYEETGLTARLDKRHWASIEYPISPIARKQVCFCLGQVSGTPRTREGEIDGFQWVTESQLEQYLFPDTAAACLELIHHTR